MCLIFFLERIVFAQPLERTYFRKEKIKCMDLSEGNECANWYMRQTCQQFTTENAVFNRAGLFCLDPIKMHKETSNFIEPSWTDEFPVDCSSVNPLTVKRVIFFGTKIKRS